MVEGPSISGPYCGCSKSSETQGMYSQLFAQIRLSEPDRTEEKMDPEITRLYQVPSRPVPYPTGCFNIDCGHPQNKVNHL